MPAGAAMIPMMPAQMAMPAMEQTSGSYRDRLRANGLGAFQRAFQQGLVPKGMKQSGQQSFNAGYNSTQDEAGAMTPQNADCMAPQMYSQSMPQMPNGWNQPQGFMQDMQMSGMPQMALHDLPTPTSCMSGSSTPTVTPQTADPDLLALQLKAAAEAVQCYED